MSSRAHSSQARRSLFGFIRVAQPLFGESDQQVVSPRPARAAALLLLFLLLLQGVAGAEARVARRVLVLYEVGPNYPAIAVLDQGISDALRNSPYQIEVYREYFDTALFPDPATQREFREWYTRKYRDRRPDIIITVGPSALGFMIVAHEAFFRDVPVVFCTSTEEAAGRAKLDPHFTGVWEEPEPTKTLEAALRLQPSTEHVFLVGGTSPYDRSIEALYRERLRNYESKLDVEYLTDLAMPQLLDRLRHLPDHSVVLHLGILRDAAGTQFIDATEAGPMVVQAANAPVFTFSDLNLGHGEAGGDVLNLAAEGKVAGATALRVLRGEKPQDIPIVKNVNVYMFDWRALHRWGLNEDNLPPGSIVLNRPPSFWQLYERYLLAGVFVLLAQSLFIFALLWQRAKRRKTEVQLRESRNQLEGVVESAMDAVIAIDDKLQIVVFNDAAEKIFGSLAKDAIGCSIYRFVPERSQEALRQQIQRLGDAGAGARGKGAIGTLWGVRTGGEEFPVEASISQTEVNGRKLLTVIIRDMTERKQAEAALRESEERFRLIANSAPVMIWMSGPDKLCTYFNRPWLEFTGRTLQAELGNGWAQGVHPEDLEPCIEIYSRAFDRRECFQTEYRLRRHDGQYRWIFDHGVPRFNADGSFAGFIGSCVDVTERRAAEEALSNVSRRLLEAHEEERSWIARELHDDFNQRIALLAVNLEGLKQDLPASSGQMSRRINEVQEHVSDLGIDIQALSHRLHSSKLEYLGLVAACEGFCRELSARQNVEIAFHSQDIPKSLPKEMALCLFRVLQEALQNAVKHSGVRQFEVLLKAASNEIQLSVHDSGVGFDPAKALGGQGLGLTSMRERLKILDGCVSIDSKPQCGTTVRASVPLSPQVKSASAVG